MIQIHFSLIFCFHPFFPSTILFAPNNPAITYYRENVKEKKIIYNEIRKEAEREKKEKNV